MVKIVIMINTVIVAIGVAISGVLDYILSTKHTQQIKITITKQINREKQL